MQPLPLKVIQFYLTRYLDWRKLHHEHMVIQFLTKGSKTQRTLKTYLKITTGMMFEVKLNVSYASKIITYSIGIPTVSFPEMIGITYLSEL